MLNDISSDKWVIEYRSAQLIVQLCNLIQLSSYIFSLYLLVPALPWDRGTT